MTDLVEVAKKIEDAFDLIFDSTRAAELEILFRLAERVGMTEDVDKIYLLLSREDVIYEKQFSEANYLIANAKRVLQTMSHAKVYRDTRKEYELSCHREFAMYIVEENCLRRNPHPPVVYEDRIADYDRILENAEKTQGQKKKAEYEKTYVFRDSAGNDVRFWAKSLAKEAEGFPVKMRKGGQIRIPMEQILQAADELDQLEGTAYRRTILAHNLYETSSGEKKPVLEYEINGVVNMAGQVAAGKSTFADALTLAMVKQQYRVVMIFSTVDEALKKAEFLEKTGYEVCTLIGNASRGRHIDQQICGRDYLPEQSSRILQQPCLLNALTEDHAEDMAETIRYGKEPCWTLRKVLKDNKVTKTTYLCPYFSVCPKTKIDRKLESADVVVTTLEGFCHCTFGAARKGFLEYALKTFDLVIMDEADRLACALDQVFAPALGVNKYLQKNSKYVNDYRTQDMKEKMQKDPKEAKFIFKLGNFEYLMRELSAQIEDQRTGWNPTDLRNFSAMSLLYKLAPDSEGKEKLPQELWDIFYQLLKPQIRQNDREREMLNMAENQELTPSYLMEKVSEIMLYRQRVHIQNRKMIQQKREELFETIEVRTLHKLMFLMLVIAFEQLYRELSLLAEGLQDPPPELREILNRSLMRQQQFMPNAPLGNTLSIEVKEDDIYIKKQFALGRALALRMPYLILDRHGQAIGANVLLMSGTGYMPGSDRFHLGNRVDYVIEAEASKRAYIANTKMINVGSTIRVSGTRPEKKNSNLRNLIRENEKRILRCTKRQENILMIVNSYEQCKVAGNEVEKLLRRNESSYGVWYLCSDQEEMTEHDAGNRWQRRDITKFKGEILIAPACVIERGHNIVDRFGNAWFDTVMFLVRPMSDPDDYNVQVQKVNGFIMNQFTGLTYRSRAAVMDAIRTAAFQKYTQLNHTTGTLSDLPEEMRVDVVASLFVVIDQIFGRLCRLGEQKKEKYPTIYWVDGAFHAVKENGFDTLTELKCYLDHLMKHSPNPLVARTLYEPFYKALTGEAQGWETN